MLEELELRRLRPCRNGMDGFWTDCRFISTASVRRASTSRGDELERSILTGRDSVELEESAVVGM